MPVLLAANHRAVHRPPDHRLALDGYGISPIAHTRATGSSARLRLWALVARAHGDDAAYAHFRDRYRNTAKTLGFEGHIAWAEAMP